MSDELNLYLVSATITPRKIEVAVAAIIVILIIIGIIVYVRRRSATSI